MANRVKIIINDKPFVVEVDDLSASPLEVRVNGKTFVVEVEKENVADAAVSGGDSETTRFARLTEDVVEMTSASAVIAPMPGNIVSIVTEAGDSVVRGQVLCTLEAMKMQNAIRSPHDGVIAEVHVDAGQAVGHGDVLVTFA